MENKKLILVVYLVASALLWYLTREGVAFLYSAFLWFRTIPGMHALREAVPLLVAALLFTFLALNTRVQSTLDEVVVELKKVTWPSYPDVVKATTVVIICIGIASLLLAGFDLAFGRIIQWLMPG